MDVNQVIVAFFAVAAAVVAWSELGRAVHRRVGAAGLWAMTAAVVALIAAPMLARGSFEGAGLVVTLVAPLVIVSFMSQHLAGHRWYVRWTAAVCGGMAGMAAPLVLL